MAPITASQHDSLYRARAGILVPVPADDSRADESARSNARGCRRQPRRRRDHRHALPRRTDLGTCGTLRPTRAGSFCGADGWHLGRAFHRRQLAGTTHAARQARSDDLPVSLAPWAGHLCPAPVFRASAFIRAAIAGSRRSFSRQRPRFGPMLPTGMPSVALISAYGTGGSWMSRAISCRESGGRCVNASRSATWRSALSSSDSAAPVTWSWMSAASGECPGASCCRAARSTRPYLPVVAVASQPGSAAGRPRDASWSTSRSQTLWPTSSASARPSRVSAADRPDQRAYRSTRLLHAC